MTNQNSKLLNEEGRKLQNKLRPKEKTKQLKDENIKIILKNETTNNGLARIG